MCGFTPDGEVSNIGSPYEIARRLDAEYSYQRGHRKGETRKEYLKRKLSERTPSEVAFDKWYYGN